MKTEKLHKFEEMPEARSSGNAGVEASVTSTRSGLGQSRVRVLGVAAKMLCVMLVGLGVVSCGVGPSVENPSFPLSVEVARSELSRLKARVGMPVRPVVVIGGLFDVGIVADSLGIRLKELVSPSASMVVVSAWGTENVEETRRKVIAALERSHPSGDANETVEVDVVGFSYGGIVARYAAMPTKERAGVLPLAGGDESSASSMKRLRIKRLFCIAVPNNGCDSAMTATLDDRVASIRNGSRLLRAMDKYDHAVGNGRNPEIREGRVQPRGLAEHLAAYEVYCYVRLEDRIVGAQNAGLGGASPWWVSNLPFETAHGDAYRDPRILADIARRLRNEPAFATEPATPVPTWGY